MKRCPNCNQTFEEEWLGFCTQDGTPLINEPAYSSEPPPTIMSPAPPEAALPQEAHWTPPGNVGSPQPQWRPQPANVWQPPLPPPGALVQAQSRSLANAAMAIGIVSITIGWLCLGPVPAIVAIVLGGIALSQIKKNPDRVGGRQAA